MPDRDQRATVVLLDDDEGWGRAWVRLLSSQGIAAEAYSTFASFRSALVRGGPNVVVLDYVLGSGLTGVDVARWLRASHREPSPLVLLSASLQLVPAADRELFDACYAKTESTQVVLSGLLRMTRRRPRRAASGTQLKGQPDLVVRPPRRRDGS